MPVYDVTLSPGNPPTNKGWSLGTQHLDRLRAITRGGTQMWVLGSALANGDRVMAWDTDASGTNKGLWRTHAGGGTITPNPAPPNAMWTALTTTVWSATAAYNVGDLVTFNGNLYSCTSAITAPTSTYTTQATWELPSLQNETNNSYRGTLLGAGAFRVIDSPDTGSWNSDNGADRTSTWRLTVSGNAAAPNQPSIDGTITGMLVDFSSRQNLRITSAAAMIAVFGSNNVDSGGGTITIELFNPGTPNGDPATDTTRWSQVVVTGWSGFTAYSQNAVVLYNSVYYRANQNIPAPTPTPGQTYTEIGRWNDTSSDYRTANDADYTNFSGISWCANRQPLNGVADPFPLNSATTYRLRYVPGGSATQAAAEIVGTPTQSHIDSSPGGGIWCGRFGTIAEMQAAFGTAGSNPHSPARMNGGQWILERQT